MTRKTLVLFLAAALAACTGTGEDERSNAPNVESQQQQLATVQGRVEGSAAIMTAFEIGSDGELEAIHEASVETNAEGEYALDVFVANGANILVRAETAGMLVGEAAVKASIDTNGTIAAPPIDLESTVKADIFVRIEGASDFEVAPGMVQLLVSADLVADLTADSDYEGSMEAVVSGVSAAAEAWSATLTAESIAATDSEMEAAFNGVAEAAAELNAYLDTAGSAEAEEAALDGFVAAVFEAHAQAGIEAEQLVAASFAAAEAMSTYTIELAEQTSAQLQSDAELIVAAAVTAAVEASATISGSATSAVESAGATLEAEIAAAAEAGASARAEIEAAWQSYKAQLDAAVESSIDATLETVADLQLFAEETAADAAAELASLSAEATASANAALAASVTAEAWAEITSASESSFLDLDVISSAEASAALELLSCVYVAAE